MSPLLVVLALGHQVRDAPHDYVPRVVPERSSPMAYGTGHPDGLHVDCERLVKWLKQLLLHRASDVSQHFLRRNNTSDVDLAGCLGIRWLMIGIQLVTNFEGL